MHQMRIACVEATVNMYVILGANGKIGRATIERLRNRGATVRAVVRDSVRARGLAAAGCDIAVADLHDVSALRKAIEGGTAVQVICPTSVHEEDASSDMESMIDTLGNALDSTLPQTILAISDYGAHHSTGTGITLLFHQLESRLRETRPELVFLRSAEHMQNWSRLIKSAAKTGVLPSMHHPLTKLFPTVSASDVGVIAAELLMKPSGSGMPRIVHVEGPRRYSAIDAAATLSRLIDREVVARELPRSDWIPVLKAAGLSDSYAELVAATFDAHNAGRIDAEEGTGEIVRGTTELQEVFLSLLH
jgi:NAD(P)H dehydrogenase (quinone)